MKKTIIAIDPGHNGAIAVMPPNANVFVAKLTDSMTDNIDAIHSLAASYRCAAVLERVGAAMPGNASGSATTFARHCGHIEASIYAFGVSIAWNPTPAQWMKIIGVPAKLEKPARKRWIKDYAARRYPHLKVALANADALAMLSAYNAKNS